MDRYSNEFTMYGGGNKVKPKEDTPRPIEQNQKSNYDSNTMQKLLKRNRELVSKLEQYQKNVDNMNSEINNLKTENNLLKTRLRVKEEN